MAITTQTAVAIGLGIVGTLLIQRIVEKSFDELLGAALQEIADTVAPEKGSVTFDVPPSAFGMLENEERDNVYYAVRHAGRPLAGYADLPVLNLADSPSGRRIFAYADYKGQRVRIAAEQRFLPRIPDPVIVQIARTLGERRSMEMVMLSALFVLESIFIVVAGILIWPSLKWSLRPVNRIRAELDARPADHANFAPLDLANAPTELVGLVGGFNQ
ncbi:MAG TPA: sensor histidine kinase N-terminal domain-containing protein, partial [Polyangiaceae bacterium]|nr:sensor histidine kinase N-terminal domain-containing protein [Polyangiaceae bacterium]